MLAALVYCYWINPSLRIGAFSWLGWRLQLRRAGLIRHRRIRACCGPVCQQGDPVMRWAVIDLLYHPLLGGRLATQRIRITVIRGGCRGIAGTARGRGSRRLGAGT